MSLRCLKQISIETDISKTSQKHLKRDVFFQTSLRRLIYVSKKMPFFVTSLRRLKYISKKNVFQVESLRRLKPNISQKRWLFSEVSNMSQKHILKVFLTIQKYRTKMVLCWKNRCVSVKNTQKKKNETSFSWSSA